MRSKVTLVQYNTEIRSKSLKKSGSGSLAKMGPSPKWTLLISVSCDKSRVEGGVEGGGGLVEVFHWREGGR